MAFCFFANMTLDQADVPDGLDRAHHIPRSPKEFRHAAGRMHLAFFLSGLYCIVGLFLRRQLTSYLHYLLPHAAAIVVHWALRNTRQSEKFNRHLGYLQEHRSNSESRLS